MDSEGFKLVFIGDSGVGKSSLVSWLINGRPPGTPGPTIGAAFCTKTYEYRNKSVKFNIWDTAGQERFRSLVKMYYKNSIGCVCVFDITDRVTFDSVNYWLKDYLENNDFHNTKIMIVGNKCDFDKSMWAVSELDIEKLSAEYSCEYILTSCQTGLNVNLLFDRMAGAVIGIQPKLKLKIVEAGKEEEDDAKNTKIRLYPKIPIEFPSWC